VRNITATLNRKEKTPYFPESSAARMETLLKIRKMGKEVKRRHAESHMGQGQS
jgi:hypothetical protein